MPETRIQRITRLLEASREGDGDASEKILASLYDEMHQIAGRLFRSQAPGHTLQPTALLNDAMVKLLQSPAGLEQARDRSHLLNLAARAMRQVLVNHARDKAAAKRGGADRRRVTLSGRAIQDVGGGDQLDILALHEGLEALALLDERQAKIVELKTFAGLSNPEVAQELGVSLRTVELDWKMARTWLANRLSS